MPMDDIADKLDNEEKEDRFVNTSNLEKMDDLPLKIVLKNLPMRAKKNLRQVSHTMKCRVETLDIDISAFTVRNENELNKVMKFPHVKKINLILDIHYPAGSMKDDTICKLIHQGGPRLKMLLLTSPNFSGENLDMNNLHLDALESLRFHNCPHLSEYMLGQLLHKSSECLKTLSIMSDHQTLPRSISFHLDRLTKLVISRIVVRDDFPQFLLSIGKQLKILEIQHTNFIGESLQGFQKKFDMLEELILQANDISINGLKEIIKICDVSLKKLIIFEKDITGDPLDGFSGELNQLKHLDVEGSAFSASGLAALISIIGPQLQYLKLPYKHDLYEEPILQYPKNQRLKVNIYFRSNGSNNDNANSLSDMFQSLGKHITSLKMPYDCMISEGLEELPVSLCNLEKIYLKHSQITDAALRGLLFISGCGLKYLNLERSLIKGNNLFGLQGKFPNLSKLIASGCQNLSDSGLYALLVMCGPQLEYLDLHDTNISGDDLEKLNLVFPQILELNLGFTKFTDNGLKGLLTASGYKLKRLYLQETEITGKIFIGKTFKLSHLSLAGCKQLTDKGLCNLLEHSGNHLKSLNLSHTNILGEGLAMTGCPVNLDWLQSLILKGCQQLTFQGLFEVISLSRKHIKHLDLSGIGITGEEFAGHELTLPKLDYLNLSNCKALTCNGYLELLRIFGSTLKTLILIDTTAFNLETQNRKPKKLLPNLKRVEVGSQNRMDTIYLNSLLRTTGGQLKRLNVPKSRIDFQAKYIPKCYVTSFTSLRH